MEATWWTQPEQLDDEQKKVVSLPKSGDHLVVGPPGSGKTNLLILRATFLHRSGTKNIVVLSFHRVLKEFLATGASNYAFSPDKIQTFMRWGTRMLLDNGVKFEKHNDFGAMHAELVESLKELAASGKADNALDCILLDEAQDYSVAAIDVIRAFAKQIFAVGDDRQNIHDVTGAIPHLEGLCLKSELKYHYRNGQNICRVADGIRNLLDDPDGLEANSQYDEQAYPSSVTCFQGNSIQEQVDHAIPEIETQLKAYPAGIVGILCPLKSDVDEVWEKVSSSSIAEISQLQKFEDGYDTFDPDCRVVVTTLHGSKGLEFRALHLMGMDKIKKFPRQRNMAYTGVTRAKTSLAVYHSSNLPGYLEKGLASVDPSQPEPTLSDLFKP